MVGCAIMTETEVGRAAVSTVTISSGRGEWLPGVAVNTLPRDVALGAGSAATRSRSRLAVLIPSALVWTHGRLCD